MENIFIKLIKEGKIRDLEELKTSFRKTAKKTHPDSVGSDVLAEKFIQFKAFFDEAREIFKSESVNHEENTAYAINDCRIKFFESMMILDGLELPHNRNIKSRENIKAAGDSMALYFRKWREDHFELFVSAVKEYDMIKNEKHKNDLANLRKPSLYMNLRPVFFDLCHYHITGLDYYKKQLMRNIDMVIRRLEENNFPALKRHLLFLIADMEKGPAVFG